MSVRRGDRCLSWMIYERTSRWAPALRVAVTNPTHVKRSGIGPTRIKEFRTLAQLTQSLPNSRPSLGLVEVYDDNVAEALDFFSTHNARHLSFVALMDVSLRMSSGKRSSIGRDHDFISDALFEAGAVDVLKTPRQIARLLPVAARLAQAGSCFAKRAGDDSIAEMAKLALPWQDD